MTTETETPRLSDNARRRSGRRKTGPRLTASLGIPIAEADREALYEYCDKHGLIAAQWVRSLITTAMKMGETK